MSVLCKRWAPAAAITAFGLAALGGTVLSGTAAARKSAGSGTPQRGGTLTMLGQSDIFDLDTVSAYYTVSTNLGRMWTRQLFTYPAPTNSPAPPKLVPDIATTIPTVANHGLSDGGKTYTIHIKKGVDWNTKPARQVTAADFVREFKTLCNPASPVGAPGLLHRHDRRHEGLLCGLCQGAGRPSRRSTATSAATTCPASKPKVR